MEADAKSSINTSAAAQPKTVWVDGSFGTGGVMRNGCHVGFTQRRLHSHVTRGVGVPPLYLVVFFGGSHSLESDIIERAFEIESGGTCYQGAACRRVPAAAR